MARSNPNMNAASQPKPNTTRRSFFEAGTESEEPEMELNLFAIVGAFLALKEPGDLVAWLTSEEHNAGKLIMFVNAVCDKYNELVTENNAFAKNNAELLASEARKDGVIQYLQDQNAGLRAENNTLHKMQHTEQATLTQHTEQATATQHTGRASSLATDLRVSQATNKQRQHKSSPGPSDNAITSTASKRHFKLDNPNRFTGEKNSIPIEQWLTQMEGKMTEDEELMDTPRRHIVYVLNRLDGRAFKHMEPRARKNASKPWKDSNKMLAHLERVFGDSNRLENAENEYQNLRQGNRDFNSFWADFQQLALEINRNEATLISDLTSKLSLEMRRQLASGDKRPTDLHEYAERCQRVYQDIKDIARATAAAERYKEKCFATTLGPATNPAAKKVATTSTTTTRTTSSNNSVSRQLTTSEQARLMKEERCFTCNETGHRTADCTKEWKPMSSLASVSNVEEIQELPLENA